MKRLTVIEQLDGRFQGLADDVRSWLSQGIIADRIVTLLFGKYGVSVGANPIYHFRRKRWVPERERIENGRIAALVAEEVAREREITASMVCALPQPAKLHGGEQS